MGIDNPTYFTIPGGLNRERLSVADNPTRRHVIMGNSRSSATSLTEHEHAGSSSMLDALVLGMPRARDVAPDPSSVTCRSSSELFSTYYNLAATVPACATSAPSRRHSIGSYFIRGKQSLNAMHRPASGQPARLHHLRASQADLVDDPTDGRKPNENQIEDIVIIRSNKSETAELWVTYLNTCLQQIRKNRNKTPFRIAVEDIDGRETLTVMNNKLKNSRLAMIIVCPAFLRHATLYSQRTRAWTAQLSPKRVLAMLLGVEEKSLVDHQIAALSFFQQWKKMESVKDRDEAFVSNFLGAAMEILGRQHKQSSKSCDQQFMLIPKKVNLCQKKVAIVFTEPLAKEDQLQVKLIRDGHEIDVNAMSKRHPCVRTFRVPDNCLSTTTLVGVKVLRNGRELGIKQLKCESQLQAMEQLLAGCDQPLDFTCQVLNIVPSDKDKLDEIFVKAFQRNIPPDFHLLQGAGLTDVARGSVCEQHEYPTLLHVAARLGLQQLCWILLDCPGGDIACELRNSKQITPAEMAAAAGHATLANALMGYMQMTQFSNAYTFLKGIVDNKRNDSEPYMSPRPVMETYLVPPDPRPCLPPPPLGYMPMSPRAQQQLETDSQHSQQRHQQQREAIFTRDRVPNQEPRKKERESVEEELIEIINDFKNNILTMEEVETLVNQWWRRNHVQQSFREKQEYLAQLREQYERVQQRMKDEMKATGRPSPMERIRNLFRSKPKEIKIPAAKSDKEKTDVTMTNRPCSSLSTVSSTSSSSGRLSYNGAEPWHTNYDIPPSPVQVIKPLLSTLDAVAESGEFHPPQSSLYIEEEKEEEETTESNNHVGLYVNVDSQTFQPQLSHEIPLLSKIHWNK